MVLQTGSKSMALNHGESMLDCSCAVLYRTGILVCTYAVASALIFETQMRNMSQIHIVCNRELDNVTILQPIPVNVKV